MASPDAQARYPAATLLAGYNSPEGYNGVGFPTPSPAKLGTSEPVASHGSYGSPPAYQAALQARLTTLAAASPREGQSTIVLPQSQPRSASRSLASPSWHGAPPIEPLRPGSSPNYRVLSPGRGSSPPPTLQRAASPVPTTTTTTVLSPNIVASKAIRAASATGLPLHHTTVVVAQPPISPRHAKVVLPVNGNSWHNHNGNNHNGNNNSNSINSNGHGLDSSGNATMPLAAPSPRRRSDGTAMSPAPQAQSPPPLPRTHGEPAATSPSKVRAVYPITAGSHSPSAGPMSYRSLQDALTVSEQKVANLTDMLDRVKGEMEALGQEADDACTELQRQLELKDLALSEAEEALAITRSELAEARAQAADSLAGSSRRIGIPHVGGTPPRHRAGSLGVGDREDQDLLLDPEMELELQRSSSVAALALAEALRDKLAAVDREQAEFREQVAAVVSEAQAWQQHEDDVRRSRNEQLQQLMGEVAFLQGTVGQALAPSPSSSNYAAQLFSGHQAHLDQETVQGPPASEADLRAKVETLQVEREEAWAAAAWQCREATKLRDSLAAAETSLAASNGTYNTYG